MSFGIASSVISVGASLLGAKKGRDAQKDAAKDANAVAKYQFDTTREDQTTAREGGRKATNELAFLLGLDANGLETTPPGKKKATPKEREAYYAEVRARKADPRFGMLTRQFTGDNLASDPGYQFGLSQGMRGLEGSALARGGLYSGNALKAASRFNQDYAGTKFGEAFNRDAIFKNQLLNPLQAMAGQGQTATGQTQQAGQNYANTVGGNAIGMGNARASSYIAQGNALSNGMNAGLYAWNQGQGGWGGGGGSIYNAGPGSSITGQQMRAWGT